MGKMFCDRCGTIFPGSNARVRCPSCNASGDHDGCILSYGGQVQYEDHMRRVRGNRARWEEQQAYERSAARARPSPARTTRRVSAGGTSGASGSSSGGVGQTVGGVVMLMVVIGMIGECLEGGGAGDATASTVERTEQRGSGADDEGVVERGGVAASDDCPPGSGWDGEQCRCPAPHETVGGCPGGTSPEGDDCVQYCVCYETASGSVSTTCRPNATACAGLVKKIQGKGSKLIVRGSVAQDCQRVVGGSVPDVLGGEGWAWTNYSLGENTGPAVCGWRIKGEHCRLE